MARTADDSAAGARVRGRRFALAVFALSVVVVMMQWSGVLSDGGVGEPERTDRGSPVLEPLTGDTTGVPASSGAIRADTPPAGTETRFRFVDSEGRPMEVTAAIDSPSGPIRLIPGSNHLYHSLRPIDPGLHSLQAWTLPAGEHWRTTVDLTNAGVHTVRLPRETRPITIELLAADAPYEGECEYELLERRHSPFLSHANPELALHRLTSGTDLLSGSTGPDAARWIRARGPTLVIPRQGAAWSRLRVRTPHGLAGRTWLSPTTPTRGTVLRLGESEEIALEVTWGGRPAPEGLRLDCSAVWSHTFPEWQDVPIRDGVAHVPGYEPNLAPCFVLRHDGEKGGLPASIELIAEGEVDELAAFDASVAGRGRARLDFERFEDEVWSVRLPPRDAGASSLEFWLSLPQPDGTRIRVFELGRCVGRGDGESVFPGLLSSEVVEVRLPGEHADVWLTKDAATRTLSLPETSEVSGRVVDPSGIPLLGMELAWSPAAETRSIRSFRTCRTVTDHEGRFSFRVAPPQDGTLRLATPGYELEEVAVAHPPPGEIEVTATPVTAARIEVVADTSLRDAVVSVYRETPFSTSVRTQACAVECPGPSSRTGISDVPLVFGAGRYRVTVALPDDLVTCRWRDVDLAGGRVVSVRLEPLEERHLLVTAEHAADLEFECRWRTAGARYESRSIETAGALAIHVPGSDTYVEVRAWHRDDARLVADASPGPHDWIVWRWEGPAGNLPAHVDLRAFEPAETTLVSAAAPVDLELGAGDWHRRTSLPPHTRTVVEVPRSGPYRIRAAGGLWSRRRVLPSTVDASEFTVERRLALTSAALAFATPTGWRLVLRQEVDEWTFAPPALEAPSVRAPIGAQATGELTNERGETRRVRASVVEDGRLLVDLDVE